MNGRVISFTPPKTRTGNSNPQPVDTHGDVYLNTLYDLLDAYGLAQEKNRLTQALPYHVEQFDLVQLLNVMVRMGYTGRPNATRLCDIDARLFPCLFVDEKYQNPRVLRDASGSGGTQKGTAYYFTKLDVQQPVEEKEARQAAGHGWFRGFLQRFKGTFIKGFAIAGVLNLIGLVLPLMLMTMYDQVVNVGKVSPLVYLAGGALIVLLAEAFLCSMRAHHLAWFTARLDHGISNRVFSRLLQLPASFIEQASVAAQVARLKAFESVREFFTSPLFLTLIELPFTLLAFMFLGAIGGWLFWIPVGVLALNGALLAAMRLPLHQANFESARAHSRIQQRHIEMFEKLQSLRLNGLSDVWRTQFRDVSASAAMFSFKAQYLNMVTDTVAHFISVIGSITLIYAGVLRVWDGTMTGGALFAAIILCGRILTPLHTVTTSLPRLQQLKNSIRQINSLMDIDTERESAVSLVHVPSIKGELEFDQVGLRYSRETDPIFTGLSFRLKQGEMLAVSGSNGSGKSTILKLLLGLYHPQAGAIRIDGRDIRQLDPVDLRQKLAYVPQLPELFDGTIAENLRLANIDAPESALWETLRMADAATDVERLPEGLATRIGGSADGLPASLAYRIGLARAYLKDAPVMLIDELPYAILNSKSGETFKNQIAKWKGQKTIVLVSHRNDYIKMADKALGILRGGRIALDAPDAVLRRLLDEEFSPGRKRV